jgi:hypothetical protein
MILEENIPVKPLNSIEWLFLTTREVLWGAEWI